MGVVNKLMPNIVMEVAFGFYVLTHVDEIKSYHDKDGTGTLGLGVCAILLGQTIIVWGARPDFFSKGLLIIGKLFLTIWSLVSMLAIIDSKEKSWSAVLWLLGYTFFGLPATFFLHQASLEAKQQSQSRMGQLSESERAALGR
eukprot:TRINITY_DN38098_c0_g1_i2.p1 TRINITY_DN38098_c0_g1~~TRINITY_DN38098_c0_g1_i2.p1  ORF type:complete len:143 (-),score=13.82 TRINITY_DN38098_c0_g1_i2:117-545(-)